jgi:hypothetical protein
MITLYLDPLTERHPEGQAHLLRCLDADCGLYEGRTLQRWQVRFRGERRVVERTLLVEQAPDGTPIVRQPWQWPCGHQGTLRVLLLGAQELVGSDAEHCPQCETEQRRLDGA